MYNHFSEHDKDIVTLMEEQACFYYYTHIQDIYSTMYLHNK